MTATAPLSAVHAPRRRPTVTAPVDLDRAASDLLEEAAALVSGRAARTLTPGAGAQVKQTLLALCAGERLQDHVAPGPTTLLGVRGNVVLHDEDGTDVITPGTWLPCPAGSHRLEATTDAVVLLTVASAPAARPVDWSRS